MEIQSEETLRPNCTFRKTGTEYIFVKDRHGRHRTFLLIANEDNTEIYLMELFRTLNRGEYAIDGSKFTSGNLYVKQQNVSAYQSIAGSGSPANQNMFFNRLKLCNPEHCR
jgi:hypothetical protein